MSGHDDHKDRVRLISAFTFGAIPLLLLNGVFIYFGSQAADCDLHCPHVTRYLTVFVDSTLIGLVLMIRLQSLKLRRDQAAWHGVIGLLLLLVPYIVLVWTWQDPRQLLYW